ncbi:uncharacterized protein METZ01_LOCUS476831 [marine metagenome]|uniref:Uncharacterized protein n=1 Tax=marine metagenome TaxID=408172 RepID=A0A383BUY3_9ZZZZ
MCSDKPVNINDEWYTGYNSNDGDKFT